MNSSDATTRHHLAVAFAAALAFAACQVAVESACISVAFRPFVLAPATFFSPHRNDLAVKLLLLLPGGDAWLLGADLDRFVPPGLWPKLRLAGELVVPNVLTSTAIAAVVALLAARRHYPPAAGLVIAALVACSLLVHAVSAATAFSVPRDWSIERLIWLYGRAYVREGGLLASSIALVSAAATFVLCRWQPRTLRLSALAGILLGSLYGLGAALPEPVFAPPEQRPGDQHASLVSSPVERIILISIDSLRADRLGCYGNARETSPAIDRLAREGVRFANAWSTTSWTLPAHMSLLTGRYVLSHGVIGDRDRLPDEIPTLAEHLRRAGYATGGVVAMLFLNARYGFGRGFDYYDDHTVPAETEFASYRDESAPAVTDLAIRWLDQHREERFFLFLHYWDVHYDYVPPAPYDAMFDPDYKGSISGENFMFNRAVRAGMPSRDLEHLLALYDGEIRWVDDHIAKLVRFLEDAGIYQNTALIVTADHGDEFFEHRFKGHRRTLYREVTQVPLLIRAPGVRQGGVVNTPASLVDVLPTVLELAGQAVPGGVDGISLVPWLVGATEQQRPGPVYAELLAKRNTNYQVMQHGVTGTLLHRLQPPRVESYAPDDVRQADDLAWRAGWEGEEKLVELARWLDAHWSEYRRYGSRPRLSMDKATEERLRALGY